MSFGMLITEGCFLKENYEYSSIVFINSLYIIRWKEKIKRKICSHLPQERPHQRTDAF